ncbi:MAG: MMPL family transporter [Gaiellaceae bacterium]
MVTHYTIFFLSACRRRLAEGEGRIDAAEHSAANVAPIVATAGLIVVAGTAALLAGELEFFRAFGPATPSHASSPRLLWPRSSRS